MKHKCNANSDRSPNRAPMEINEMGEVVFSELPRDPMDFIKPKRKRSIDKPTPLFLCGEISKIFRNTMREKNDDPHIHGSYRDILFYLAKEDGRTQLELANLTHLKPPSVSVALAKLEDQGYIIRKADPMDQRKIRVYLTEKGKSIDTKAHEVISVLESKAMTDFTPEEIKQLTVLLYRLRENIADEKE